MVSDLKGANYRDKCEELNISTLTKATAVAEYGSVADPDPSLTK
jgi:hypothetical protein